VIAGRLLYYPLPASGTGSSAAILEDAFTFVLTARHAQPVTASLGVEVVAANHRPNAEITATTKPSTPVVGNRNACSRRHKLARNGPDAAC